LDPIGTIMLLIARFGWGKPVQFDPFNLRHPRRDAAIISLAGPVSNLLVAFIASVALQILFNARLMLLSNSIVASSVYLVIGLIQPLIVLNVVLAVFNLIPIHPLDGFKIVGGILPGDYARQWQELESYGMIFLIFLIFPFFGGTSPVHSLISPIINTILSVLLPSAPLI
jgi:Zn-dependent protease